MMDDKIILSSMRRRSDHELQLVRRLDWRFLLPEPHLRRVTYLGPVQGTLPAALKCFSASFQINTSAEDASADLVVLHLGEAAPILDHVASLLVPGGFLYWEMKPRHWFASLLPRTVTREQVRQAAANRWRRTLALFRGEIDALANLGFREIEMYWLRPNFE